MEIGQFRFTSLFIKTHFFSITRCSLLSFLALFFSLCLFSQNVLAISGPSESNSGIFDLEHQGKKGKLGSGTSQSHVAAHLDGKYEGSISTVASPSVDDELTAVRGKKIGTFSVSNTAMLSIDADATESIRKSLYYGEADAIPASEDLPEQNRFSRDLAAFRYLDLSYELDPETNQVIYQFGDGLLENSFDKLYGERERNRIAKTLKVIKKQLEQNPGNSVIERYLMDVYFDQAVAEVMVGNQLLDQARDIRLRDSDIATEADLYKSAAMHFSKRLSTYNELFVLHTDVITKYADKRGDLSPRYRDANNIAQNVTQKDKLYSGYKDVRVYYELMSKWVEALLKASRLEALGRHNNQVLIGGIKENILNAEKALNDYEGNIRALFSSVDFAAVNGASGLPEAYSRFNVLLSQLTGLREALSGGTNLLGLPKNAVFLFGHQNNSQSPEGDSFDIITQRHSPQTGFLKKALEDQTRAEDSFDDLQLSQDALGNDLSDRLQVINNRLVELIGFKLDSTCSQGVCAVADDTAIRDSAISSQRANIETAIQALEAKEKELQNTMNAIKVEIERIGKDKGIENAISQVEIRYDKEQISIQKRIAEVRLGADRARNRIRKLRGFVKTARSAEQVAAAGAWAGAITSFMDEVSTVTHALRGNRADIREIARIGDLNILSPSLAIEERSRIVSVLRDLLDVNRQFFIRNVWLRVKTVEMDIAIAEANVDAEIERLIGMYNSVTSLSVSASRLRIDQADRHFADPIHLTRESASAVRAELSFTRAQEWMFYAVQALEHKWQEPFVDKFGRQANSVFRRRSARELEDFYHELVAFDDISKWRYSSERSDVVSMKMNILGYYDTIRRKIQCYPHPFPERREQIERDLGPSLSVNECEFRGDGTLLDANHAFRAYLAGSIVTQAGAPGEEWISLKFATTRQVPRSLLFSGPRRTIRGGESCFVNGGNYNDKIVQVGVNVVTNEQGVVDKVPLQLTYGGSSYFRAKLTFDAEDIEKSIDKIEAIAPRFEEASASDANTLTYTGKNVAELHASVVTGSGGTLNTGTFAFKGHSVAASDWSLEVLQKNHIGSYYEINDINDINLVIRHNYAVRQVNTCMPILRPLFSRQPFEALSEESWLMEENMYMDSLK